MNADSCCICVFYLVLVKANIDFQNVKYIANFKFSEEEVNQILHHLLDLLGKYFYIFNYKTCFAISLRSFLYLSDSIQDKMQLMKMKMYRNLVKLYSFQSYHLQCIKAEYINKSEFSQSIKSFICLNVLHNLERIRFPFSSCVRLDIKQFKFAAGQTNKEVFFMK